MTETISDKIQHEKTGEGLKEKGLVSLNFTVAVDYYLK